MNGYTRGTLHLAILMALAGTTVPVSAAVVVQCPGDLNGNAQIDPNESPDPNHPNAKCMHLTGGDGFATMGDGKELYTFGFSNVTGTRENQVMNKGELAANFPAPTIKLKQGQEFYLTLTNVGMIMRPDLFDPHTVHFHGFPDAASVFDGVPDASISINGGSSLTYYYNIVEPGTYMYHCHVEATEHMQMGMLGNLYVEAAQNDLADGTDLNGFTHQTGYKYVYNDGDGSTHYDVELPVQMGSFDGNFHDLHINVQPLPFANMEDRYAMLNGRGYPDTVNPDPLPPPASTGRTESSQPVPAIPFEILDDGTILPVSVTQGQKLLLRISDLNVTRFYTLTAMGLPMQVVGTGARQMRGPDGAGGAPGTNTDFGTASVTVGGGEAVDVIVDTTNVAPGTYFLYTTNLNYLSNDQEDYGGMMTEIQIDPAPQA